MINENMVERENNKQRMMRDHMKQVKKTPKEVRNVISERGNNGRNTNMRCA
jgi:hypothetical protein